MNLLFYGKVYVSVVVHLSTFILALFHLSAQFSLHSASIWKKGCRVINPVKVVAHLLRSMVLTNLFKAIMWEMFNKCPLNKTTAETCPLWVKYWNGFIQNDALLHRLMAVSTIAVDIVQWLKAVLFLCRLSPSFIVSVFLFGTLLVRHLI